MFVQTVRYGMRIFVFLLLCLTGFSARAENETAEKLRFPVAAGVYYPAAAEETKSRIDDLLAAARGRFRTGTGKSPKAVIVPHDSLFSESGRVAAAAYAALMKIKPFVRRVVIVASPQHGKHFGVMLSSARYWTLPSGQRFETDGALIAKLKQIQGIDYDDAAFEAEEAIEVQLPFIAAVFRPDVKIVPILAGDAGIDQISDVIDLVWGGSETAIVFASDMAKGENAAKTAEKDERTARILEKKEDVPLGKDRLSAPRPVEGLLAYLRETGGEINRLDLQSGTDLFSGEAKGYGAFAVYENDAAAQSSKEETENLLKENQNALLRVAAQSIVSGFERGRPLRVRLSRYPEALRRKGATFVSIYYDGALRGSAGSAEAVRPIIDDIAENAYAAAFSDFRFNPLTQEELQDAEISISLLTRRTRIKFSDESDLLSQIRPKTDGLVVRERANTALFLPQIWDSFSSPKEFLAHLKRKAGLPPDYQSPTLKVYRFEVIDISSGDLEDPASVWRTR